MWWSAFHIKFLPSSFPLPQSFHVQPPLLNSHLVALGWIWVSEAGELWRPLSTVLCEQQSPALLKVYDSRTQRTFRLSWEPRLYNTLSCWVALLMRAHCSTIQLRPLRFVIYSSHSEYRRCLKNMRRCVKHLLLLFGVYGKLILWLVINFIGYWGNAKWIRI